jgi:hypothetical protein
VGILAGGGSRKAPSALGPSSTAYTHVGSAGAPASTAPGRTPALVRRPLAPAVTASAVRTTLSRELGVRSIPGGPAVTEVTCARGACVIRYREVARGAGRIFADQIPLMRELAANSAIRQVTLLVYHVAFGVGLHKILPIFEVRCGASAIERIATGAGDISALCAVVERSGLFHGHGGGPPTPGQYSYGSPAQIGSPGNGH